MKIQTLYGVFSTAKMSSPETQFMDSLLERKVWLNDALFYLLFPQLLVG